jgi:hypothetical protein
MQNALLSRIESPFDLRTLSDAENEGATGRLARAAKPPRRPAEGPARQAAETRAGLRANASRQLAAALRVIRIP